VKSFSKKILSGFLRKIFEPTRNFYPSFEDLFLKVHLHPLGKRTLRQLLELFFGECFPRTSHPGTILVDELFVNFSVGGHQSFEASLVR